MLATHPVAVLGLAFHQASNTNDYLNSLLNNLIQAKRACEDQSTEEIPAEHYSSQSPMAGWTGYKHRQWGGYLDHL